MIKKFVTLFKFLFWIVWLTFLFFFAFHLVQHNSEIIQLDIWGFVIEQPIGVIFLGVLIFGFLLGLFTLAIPLLLTRLNLRRLKAKSKVNEDELKQLRMAPLQG